MSAFVLPRLAAVAGAASAVVLLVNTAKRAGVLPDTTATQLVALGCSRSG